LKKLSKTKKNLSQDAKIRTGYLTHIPFGVLMLYFIQYANAFLGALPEVE
jgi:hypothetical protein